MKVGIDYARIYAGHIIVTDKWYIGQTTRDFEDRKYEHIYDSFNLTKYNHSSYNCAFHQAIRTYGAENVEWFIIEDNIPVPYHFEGRNKISDYTAADGREIYWIADKNSFEQGYNMTKGGRAASTVCCTPICQYTKDGKKVGEYESVGEASRKTGISRQNITQCLIHRSQSAGKFIWKYASEDLDQIEKYNGSDKGSPKSICQYNKDGKKEGEYNSAAEASRLTGINRSNISHCLRGNIKSAGGYGWAYAS